MNLQDLLMGGDESSAARTEHRLKTIVSADRARVLTTIAMTQDDLLEEHMSRVLAPERFPALAVNFARALRATTEEAQRTPEPGDERDAATVEAAKACLAEMNAIVEAFSKIEEKPAEAQQDAAPTEESFVKMVDDLAESLR